jgi:EAL domain-containing protein (putative c-di-GMP-specific phosphodiesterase class I)
MGEDLAADLPRALERGELLLHYQPIVRLRGGDSVRVEALLRWKHPRAGLVPPIEVLRAAQAAGLLAELGSFVLDAALLQAAAWRKDGLRLDVAVNLSAAELHDPHLADRVGAALRARVSDPAWLTLEVPASALSSADALDTLRRLTTTGARVAIDDISRGDPLPHAYGSLIDELKISRALVTRLIGDVAAADAVREVVEQARDFGIPVVAVGVEDQRTRDLLVKLGCDEAQGYWMSRPLLAHDVTPWANWAAGLAFAGSLALSGLATARAASASSSGSSPLVESRTFLPTVCALDVPIVGGGDRAHALQPDEIERCTGLSFASLRGWHADLHVEEGIELEDLRRLSLALEEAVRGTERDYGRAFAQRPLVYAFATRASFAHGLERGFGYRGAAVGMLAAGNGGVTLTRAGAIAINWSLVRADSSLAIVRHEVTHAMVHQIVGPNVTLPAWVDEGLATLAQRDAEGDGAPIRDPFITLSLLASGQASLAALDSSADWSIRNAQLNGQGYRISGEAVRLLGKGLGSAGFAGLLAETARFGDFAAAYASVSGESLATFVAAFPARLAAQHPAPGVEVRPAREAGGDAVYVVHGFAPRSEVTIRINGPAYELAFPVVTDAHGMYAGSFGSTAPPGEFALLARGPGGTASASLHVERAGGS